MRRRALPVLLALALFAGCAPAQAPPPSPRQATAAARSFLGAWVDRQGKVGTRPSSSTQAYALLLAVAARDERTFDRVWSWTRRHLQRPDGLLTGRPGGRGTEALPRSDADLLAAWSLALAAGRFDRPALARTAAHLGRGVLREEVGIGTLGRPTLAAGPWAVGTPARPTLVSPGALAPPAATALARLLGDDRFADLPAAWQDHLRMTTRDGELLPPDWALVDAARVRPVPGPDATVLPTRAQAQAAHGPRAQQALLWSSCTAIGRALAGRTWQLLRVTAHRAPAVRALDGSVLVSAPAPVAAVSAAATAASAGDAPSSYRLLGLADELAARHPTPYGDAWAALGRVLLTTDQLADCG